MDKKINLKAYILNELMREGYLTLDKVHAIAESLGHKESYAERELRPSRSPMVETIYSEKPRYVLGYKYKYWKPAVEKEVKEMTATML